MGRKGLICLTLATAVIATAPSASAQLATPEDRADCARRLVIAEQAIAKDSVYAHAWTDSWIFVASSLVVLNVTRAYQYGDYIRGEALALAGASLLMMIDRPLALTSDDALRGLRTSATEDPCLALADTKWILKSNSVDGEKHQELKDFLIPVFLNAAIMGILAGVSGHWDFVGHSQLGFNTLLGTALSEVKVLTYPQGSLKTVGSSLEVSF